MKFENSDYNDIIDLPHFHDPARPYMSRKKRAAQFAPFKSLGGYHESIDDVADEVNDVVWEDIER
ncbi:hypothetical protein IJG28_00335 [Candidatus Saccharibacteria bacterium]|nr:hypothetical protein [Candidatus Saccharibacteria bacterium]